MDSIPGGIVAPDGFRTAGVHTGVKHKRNDLALIVSDVVAVVAGVFTTNVVHAPCIDLNKDHLKDGFARAVVVNSGNANACNGVQGRLDAEAVVAQTAKALNLPACRVFCASTGIIGQRLPTEKVLPGICAAASRLHRGHCDDAVQGIMTTDTFPKQTALEFEVDGKRVRLGGIAKGSGMIEPNMATMLGFVTTDAAIDQPVLQAMLRRICADTFNAISVDGDTSTNDMVLVLANGLAGNKRITDAQSAGAKQFELALYAVCLHLAKEIVRDGEGATKLVEVTVQNVSAAQRADMPRIVAKTIANSPLVKTALFGNDPNWGRVLAAAGRSGLQFDPERVDITLAGTTVYHSGCPTDFSNAAVSEAMSAREIQIAVDFHQPGGETDTVWACDLGPGYVEINASYKARASASASGKAAFTPFPGQA